MTRQFIAALFCLTAVNAFAQPVAPVTTTQVVTRSLLQSFNAQPFHAIDINGPINVQIKEDTALRQPSLELMGDKQSLAYIYAAVREGVLYLGLQPGAQKANILVKVKVSNLDQMLYAGSGNVVGENMTGPFTIASNGTGTVVLVGKDLDLQNLRATNSANLHILGIRSTLLTIDDRSSGKINLNGDMVLGALNYQGSGPLSIQWINSSNVNVTGSGSGRIFLAGIAGQLNATLSDHVTLDAKYLHANKGFINTRDKARADVWTKYNLSALATKGSTIYYYHDSQMVGGYMIAPGSVIRMTGLATINR